MRTTLLILFLVGINFSAISQKCINKPISPKEAQTNKNFFSGYMNVNGLRMYYEISGKGPTLLFIHGCGLCTEAYRSLINRLSQNFRVIAADNQSQGRTGDIDREFTYKNMALDQITLLKKLNVDSVIVMGHSDGANVALNMAIYNQPNKIKKMIVVSGNFRPNGLLDYFYDLISSLNPDEIQNEWYNLLSPDDLAHWPVVARKQLNNVLTQPNITHEELNGIKIPTLIIAADQDIIKIEHTTEMYNNIPKSKLLIVPNSTHYLLDEKPDLVLPIIYNFIGKK